MMALDIIMQLYALLDQQITHGIKKVAYGINTDRKYFGLNSRHAEVDALLKLKFATYGNLGRQFDMYIFRLSKDGILMESRPCYHCLKYMTKIKLTIKNIYYSTKNHTIIKTTLSKLLSDDKQYIVFGERHKKSKMKN